MRPSVRLLLLLSPPAIAADFVADSTTGEVGGAAITFSDLSTGEVAAWLLEFSVDGGAWTTLYDSPPIAGAWEPWTPVIAGTYSFRLTVTDSAGRQDDELKTNYITITAPE